MMMMTMLLQAISLSFMVIDVAGGDKEVVFEQLLLLLYRLL
jgi:hypothetical protein